MTTAQEEMIQRFNDVCKEDGKAGVRQVVKWMAGELDRVDEAKAAKTPARKKGS